MPRSRGDGPKAVSDGISGCGVAPLARGWTLKRVGDFEVGSGCPARAGMDPSSAIDSIPPAGLPRSRGDGPRSDVPNRDASRVAPLARGWTLVPLARQEPVNGCPARAGMDPRASGTGHGTVRLPRSRGDGPWACRGPERQSPVAPLARGWTQDRAFDHDRSLGCPARAGMDPTVAATTRSASRLPRSRGDGPRHRRRRRVSRWVAPLARGWTLDGIAIVLVHRGCPARAGMDPGGRERRQAAVRLPRSRGDGPLAAMRLRKWTSVAPLARGWTRFLVRCADECQGCPARAGMDPRGVPAPEGEGRLPRSRGDGPGRARLPGAVAGVAPLARGWTLRFQRTPDLQKGCPARAGMDPCRSYRAASVAGLPRSRGDGPLLIHS